MLNRAALAAALLLGVQANAAELVVNGGFETGDFTGWTVVNGGDAGFSPHISDIASHSGTYVALLDDIEPSDSFSQDIATTVGETYRLTFWLRSDFDQNNEIVVEFGGQEVVHLVDAPAAFDYTLYTYDLTATSTTSTVEFRGYHAHASWRIDDVSVVLCEDCSTGTPMPEPATLAILGLGLAGLGALRRRTG